jgi:hypothetical protein
MLLACNCERYTLIDICFNLTFFFTKQWQKFNDLRCDRLRNTDHSVEIANYPIARIYRRFYMRVVERHSNVDLYP